MGEELMSWVLLALGLVAMALLGAMGHRSSARRGAGRLAEAFIWGCGASLPVLAALHALESLATFMILAVLVLVLLAVAFRLLHAHRVAQHGSLRLASYLLVNGSVVVWMGAATWPGADLAAIAARRADHYFTSGAFFVGALLTLAGFVALRNATRERGERTLSDLGACALLIGTTCWAAHLAFRATVVVAVASLGSPLPEWYLPLRGWSGAMYAVYMALAYLAAAAFGAAMLKAGLVGRRSGRVLVILGLVAAAGFIAQTGVFNPPLMVQFLPYVMGVMLLRRAMRESRGFDDPGDHGFNGDIPNRRERETEQRLRLVLEKFSGHSLGNLRAA